MKTGLLAAVVAFGLCASLASAQIYIQPSNNDDAQRSQARRAAVQAAQGEVDRAQATLEAVNTRIAAGAKANPEMLAAERDLAVKQAVFEKSRQPLLAKLKADPAYQDAAKQAHAADATVKQEQSIATAALPATTNPATATTLPVPSESQVQAATEKLEQKSAIHDMEAAAIAADPEASRAQTDLDAAREKLKVLHLQADAAKLNDPEYKAALDGLNSAKSRLTAAAGQY